MNEINNKNILNEKAFLRQILSVIKNFAYFYITNCD